MKNISVGTHKLKLDFSNGANGVLFSTQADSGRTFEVQVLDEENNVQDITGLTLDFFVGTSKEVTKVSATIKDAVNGIFEVNAVSGQFKYAGVHKAQFVLRDATGAKIGTQIYNIHVEESIENGATVGENVIVSFEAVSEAAELLRNSGAVLEESKEVSATLKTDITKAETIDTTLKATTKTAEDTNTKAQSTNATLNETIETANTANANTINTLNQLTVENDEATLNITALDEKNKLATTNITDLTSSTNTANTSNTNLKATITNAETAEEKLKKEIVNAGLENYITLEDIKSKADLGADGTVLPEQIPLIGGTNLLRGTSNPIEYDMLTSEYYKEYITNVKLEPDTEYTLSFVAERLSQDSVPIALALGGGNDINAPLRHDYLPRFIQEVKFSQKNSYTFKFTKDGMTSEIRGYNPYLVLRFRNDLKATKIRISQLKLEKGTVATDWSPAPLDKADLGADGKVLPNQLPKYEVNFTTPSDKIKKFIKIKIKSTSAYMIALNINLYKNYEFSNLVICGYNSRIVGSENWYTPSTAHLGVSAVDEIPVTFGYDEPNELWVAFPQATYSQMTISGSVNGFRFIPNFYESLEVTEVDDLSGTIQKTVVAKRSATIADLPTKEQLDRASIRENDITNATALKGTDIDLHELGFGYYVPFHEVNVATFKNCPTRYSFTLEVKGLGTVKTLILYENIENGKMFKSEFRNGVWSNWKEFLTTNNIVNNLTTATVGSALDATQGKTIWDHIVANQANWNKDTKYNVATTTLNGLMSSTDKIKLDNLKEHVIMTQSDYDALSDAQKNDATKIYLVGA